MTAQVIQFPALNHTEGRQPGDQRSPYLGPGSSNGRRAMSHKATDWAWEQPVRGVTQHVLLALAERANVKTRKCSPSLPELSARTGLAENTIRSHIKVLRDAGLIHADVSSGGRRQRSTYTMLMDGGPSTEAQTPQEMRGRGAPPTPQEMDPVESETPQELSSYPSGAEPVVLRTNTRTREPGSTPAADAAPEPAADGGLFAAEAPVEKTGRDLAVVQGSAVEPQKVTGQTAAATWIDAFRATGRQPLARQIKQVGKEAADLLRAGNDPDYVLALAERAGRKRRATIANEMAYDVPQRDATTDVRVQGGLALANYYEGIGQ